MYRLWPIWLMAIIMGCNSGDKFEKSNFPVQLVTVDPGHFHAALIQKTMYPDVDSVVHVYAPEGNDLKLHLGRVDGYNSRKENPTHWKGKIYTGDDYFEMMLKERRGNVIVLAGNNRKKTDYIARSLEAGFNVLADKPMVINTGSFEQLKQAFETAKKNNLLLYDIMTERFEITSILQRELSMMPEIFGALEKGTLQDPAVIMVSDHNFYKYISGNVVVRPAWFMDAAQQGQGIVDVTTHLVDLVQWQCFPGQSLDYRKDITIDSAKCWPTIMSHSEFKTITKLGDVPSYLDKNNDTSIKVWSNGDFNYTIKGVHAKVRVWWDYQTPAGVDTHFSLMVGTNASIAVLQTIEEAYKPTLYIKIKNNDPNTEKALMQQFQQLQNKYPGIEIKQEIRPITYPHGNVLNKMAGKRYVVVIPDKYKEGHEAHFARVTENFLSYLKNHNMPAWEVPNMLAKYYTTTKALELALKNK